MITGSPRAEKVNAAAAAARRPIVANASRENWSATKAIIFDDATKTVRKPTAAETADLVRSLRQMTTKPARAIQSTSAGMAGSTTRQGSINGAFANVVIARANPDGSMETRCVQTFEEAAEFLGLVEQPSGATQQ
jgi:hypothetical protein